MTGEITLTGLVLPVGGIKEKVLAAHRAGLRRVLLPQANAKDLRTLPENVRKDMQVILVERITDALREVLTHGAQSAPTPAGTDGQPRAAQQAE